jgi:tetratricopeptide (TPR) repeat protein
MIMKKLIFAIAPTFAFAAGAVTVAFALLYDSPGYAFSSNIGKETSVCPGGCSSHSPGGGTRGGGGGGGGGGVSSDAAARNLIRAGIAAGDDATAISYYERALSLTSDPYLVANIRANLANSRAVQAHRQHDWQGAIHFSTLALSYIEQEIRFSRSVSHYDDLVGVSRRVTGYIQSARAMQAGDRAHAAGQRRDWAKAIAEYLNAVRYLESALTFIPQDPSLIEALKIGRGNVAWMHGNDALDTGHAKTALAYFEQARKNLPQDEWLLGDIENARLAVASKERERRYAQERERQLAASSAQVAAGPPSVAAGMETGRAPQSHDAPGKEKFNPIEKIPVPHVTDNESGSRLSKVADGTLEKLEVIREKADDLHAWYNDPLHREWVDDAKTIAAAPFTIEAGLEASGKALQGNLASAAGTVGGEIIKDKMEKKLVEKLFGWTDKFLESVQNYLAQWSQQRQATQEISTAASGAPK